MRIIAITRTDGGCSIMRVLDPRADLEAEVAKWAAGSGLAAASWAEIAPETVPADRTYRDAWTVAHGAVAIDMPRARAIHLDRIRLDRDAELRKLDVAFSRALGGKDQVEADAIEARRQALRDLPHALASDLAAAATAEELKAISPDIGKIDTR